MDIHIAQVWILASIVFVQVVAGGNVQILQRGKTLRLLKAATADTGRYSCKAINVAGSTEKAFHLDVLGESTHWSITETRDSGVWSLYLVLEPGFPKGASGLASIL